MTKKLPILLVDGEKFVLDEQLNELRAIDNPSNVKAVDDVDTVCVEMDDEEDAEFIAETFNFMNVLADGNLLCFEINDYFDLMSEVEIKESLFSTFKKRLFGEEV